MSLEEFNYPGVSLKENIGYGLYGTVFRATIPGGECAIKFFKKEDGDKDSKTREELYVHECNTLRKLRHPNIVQFFGICRVPYYDLPGLVTEKLTTNLYTLITKNENDFPIDLKFSILRDVAGGLLFLHSQDVPIIHRDLTARNVLLTSSMVAKIADLGMARFIPGPLAELTKSPGQKYYMPPEAYVGKYDESLNVFSFGIIILFTLLQKFPESDDYTKDGKMADPTEVQCRKASVLQLQKEFKGYDKLIEGTGKCLLVDSKKRPKMKSMFDLLEEAKKKSLTAETKMNKMELILKLKRKNEAHNVLQRDIKAVQQEKENLMKKNRELEGAIEDSRRVGKLVKEERDVLRRKREEVKEIKDALQNREKRVTEEQDEHRGLPQKPKEVQEQMKQRERDYQNAINKKERELTKVKKQVKKLNMAKKVNGGPKTITVWNCVLITSVVVIGLLSMELIYPSIGAQDENSLHTVDEKGRSRDAIKEKELDSCRKREEQMKGKENELDSYKKREEQLKGKENELANLMLPKSPNVSPVVSTGRRLTPILAAVTVGCCLLFLLLFLSCYCLCCLCDYTGYAERYGDYKSSVISRFEPIANFQCSAEGFLYIADHHDVKVYIPEGAISQGNTVSVEIYVTLYGPFSFPDGLRPISPIIWLCVRNEPNYCFLKPVTVTIPHFLDLTTDSDITSLGLTFLKASHNPNHQEKYEFLPTDGEMTFELHSRFGILQTSHFCSLCIASKDIPECIEKTSFCITAILPNNTIPVGKKVYGYFYVTFQLRTCLRRVNQLIDKINLEGYEVSKVEFRFGEHAALDMIISQPTHGVIGVRGQETILCSEVDFFVREGLTKEELEEREREEFYPPRFHIFFASSRKNATLNNGRIEFKGATKKLIFDIYLDRITTDIEIVNDETASSIAESEDDDPSSEQQDGEPSHLGINDLFEVKSKLIEVGVGERWRSIGLALGLKDPQLTQISARSSHRDTETCLEDMLRLWLNRAYKTKDHGSPTWRRLSEAVRHRAGGDNPAAAEQIIQNM